MATVYLLLTLCFSLVYGGNSKNLQTIFDETENQILETITYGVFAIEETSQQIKQLVRSAEDSVEKLDQQLQELVEEADLEAGKQSKDISSCDISEFYDHKKINQDKIAKCKGPAFFIMYTLQGKISKSGELKLQLDTDFNYCLKARSRKKILNCLDKSNESIVNQLSLLKEEVDKTIREALKNIYECVGTSLSELSKNLDEIGKQYISCFKTILELE